MWWDRLTGDLFWWWSRSFLEKSSSSGQSRWPQPGREKWVRAYHVTVTQTLLQPIPLVVLTGAKILLSLKTAWDSQSVKQQQQRWLRGGGGSFVHAVTKSRDCVNALDIEGTEVSALIARHGVAWTWAAVVPWVGTGDTAESDLCHHWSH